MTDFDRLLAAIRDNPGEDAPRLVWADWLEENAGTVACAACKGEGKIGVGNNGNPYMATCDECNGSRRVSDGRAELAAFVRVQVRIAELNRGYQESGHSSGGPMRGCVETSKLIARERELWPAVHQHLPIGSCFENSARWTGEAGESRGHPLILIRRGLPAVVRCTLAEWMGGTCERCGGARLVQRVPPREANYDAMGSVENCPACGGTGRTPGIGPRLAQRWPIVAVEVTNREPSDGSVTRWNGFAGGYGWFRVEVFPGNPNEREDLPKEVFDRLTGGQIIDKDTNWRVYDSEHAARAALSDALIAWARGQVIEETK